MMAWPYQALLPSAAADGSAPPSGDTSQSWLLNTLTKSKATLTGDTAFRVIADPTGSRRSERTDVTDILNYLLAQQNSWTRPQTFTDPGSLPLPNATVTFRKGLNTATGIRIEGPPTSFDGKNLVAMWITDGVDALQTDPIVYINDGCHIRLRTSLVVSGHWSGTGNSYSITPPVLGPSAHMIGVWSDINGPAVQARANNNGSGERAYDAMDADGNFVASINYDGSLSFGAGATWAHDAYLRRAAADTLAMWRTTNAQTLQVFRTRTDANNYERAALQTGSGYVELAAETAGTGTDDLDVRLTPAGAGGVNFPGGTLLKTRAALSNGAAASTGTLLNAPAGGNPTKWIPINDNGTTRYIPAW